MPLRIESTSNQAVPEFVPGLTTLQLVFKECCNPQYVRQRVSQPDALWVLLLSLGDLPLSIPAHPLGLDLSVYCVLKWAIIAGPYCGSLGMEPIPRVPHAKLLEWSHPIPLGIRLRGGAWECQSVAWCRNMIWVGTGSSEVLE